MPVNPASVMRHNIVALRALGIDARGLVRGGSKTQSADYIRSIDDSNLRRGSLRWFRVRSRMLLTAVSLILWADAVHWYSGLDFLPRGLDFALIRLLRKPAVNTWTGSEIRIPEVEAQDNPYYRSAWASGYEYSDESLERSCTLQARCAGAHMTSIAGPGMLQYLDPALDVPIVEMPNGLPISEITPLYPDPAQRRPLIVHAPTAPVAKGTAHVLRAIEELRSVIDFEFVLVEGVPRSQALETLMSADIVLDQFVLGDYGMAAVEAMALGKPVVCFVKPSVAARYPSNLPILNANPDNLAGVLLPLIEDGVLRHRIGRASRAYAELNHDSSQLAKQLVTVYERVIDDRSSDGVVT
jgi:glycosyltransferase involved in cell wall biosynthesis